MTLGSAFTLLGYLVGAAVYVWAGRDGVGAELARPGRGDPADRPRALRSSAPTGYSPSLLILAAGLLSGILGAKLVQWVLLGWPWHGDPAAILEPDLGGRTIIAGLICGWIGVEVAKWRLGIKQSTGDPFALALPAGEAVGRIGCFFNQCCYGAPTSLPHCLPLAVYQHGAWRLPAQLYASAIALAIFLILLALRRRMARQGDLFRLFLVLYGAGRFGLEFARYRDHLYFGLDIAQWVCLELVLAGAAMLVIPRLLAGKPGKALAE